MGMNCKGCGESQVDAQASLILHYQHTFKASIWYIVAHMSYIPVLTVTNHNTIYFQCYYVGGLEISATNILGTMAGPFKHHMPPLKICEKLKENAPQICELKYGR